MTTGWWHRRWVTETVVALAVLLAGMTVGSAYHKTFRASGAKEDFGQREFSAAVALACGRGFVDLGYALTPELDKFLALERDSVDCASLPPTAPRPPNFTQRLYRYLMSTVAMVWKVRGVSWSRLSPLFGLVYGLTLVAAYGLFRLGTGRGIALAMTTALGVSAVHLGYLPYLRDYAKAPFILALVLIMARLARDPFEPRRALGWSLAFGLVMGVGFGFRNDLLINIVPWIGVVLLCTRGGILKNLPLKAACLALSITTFIVVALPILSAYGQGSNSGHVALLGLMTAFDAPLGIAGSIYEWGYTYSDGLASTMINSYSYRLYGHPLEYVSSEYDKAMVEYILKIARHWPADILTRAYGSVLAVLEFPFKVGAYINRVPYGIKDPRILALYDGQIAVLELLQGWGLYFVGGALALIAATSVRASLILLLFVLYFAGYPAIQFSVRHFFHLEVIVWWALGFLLQRAYETVRRRPSALGFTVPSMAAGARRAVVFAGITAVIVLVPVAGLRAYQERHVRRLLADQYIGASREPIDMETKAAGRGRTLVALPALWAGRDRRQSVSASYVVAEFSSANCKVGQVTATFRYAAKTPATDFSHDVIVKVLPGGQPTEVFFPGYYSDGWTQLSGVELPTEDAGCLSRVYKIADAKVPELLLNLNVTPHWQQAKLYQTLVDFEKPDGGDGAVATPYSYPAGLPTGSFATAVPLKNADRIPGPSEGIVKAEQDEWTIHGRPATEYAYLLQFRPQEAAAGSKVVLEGEIQSGAMSVGLLKDDRWAGMVNVVTLGPFVATIAVEQSGTYQLVVADFSRPRWVTQHVPAAAGVLPGFFTKPSPVEAVITKTGWVIAAGN